MEGSFEVVVGIPVQDQVQFQMLEVVGKIVVDVEVGNYR